MGYFFNVFCTLETVVVLAKVNLSRDSLCLLRFVFAPKLDILGDEGFTGCTAVR